MTYQYVFILLVYHMVSKPVFITNISQIVIHCTVLFSSMAVNNLNHCFLWIRFGGGCTIDIFVWLFREIGIVPTNVCFICIKHCKMVTLQESTCIAIFVNYQINFGFRLINCISILLLNLSAYCAQMILNIIQFIH